MSLPSGYTADNCCVISCDGKPTENHGWTDMLGSIGYTIRINKDNKVYMFNNHGATDWIGKPVRIVLMRID